MFSEKRILYLKRLKKKSTQNFYLNFNDSKRCFFSFENVIASIDRNVIIGDLFNSVVSNALRSFVYYPSQIHYRFSF